MQAHYFTSEQGKHIMDALGTNTWDLMEAAVALHGRIVDQPHFTAMLQSLDEMSRDNVWHRIQAMRRSAAAAQKGGGSNSNGGSSSSKQPHVAARCQPSGSQTSTASGEEAKGETTEQKNTPQQPAAPGSSAGATPYSLLINSVPGSTNERIATTVVASQAA